MFTQLQEKLGDNSCQRAPLPASAELGVDITQSIFATYVRKRLAALAVALVQPETAQVAIILRSLATVFMGLAESLNLPGFGAIAQTAIAALDAHPEAGEAAQTVRITPLGDVFSRLHQVLKQLVALYSKPAELQLSGTQSNPHPCLSAGEMDSN